MGAAGWGPGWYGSGIMLLVPTGCCPCLWLVFHNTKEQHMQAELCLLGAQYCKKGNSLSTVLPGPPKLPCTTWLIKKPKPSRMGQDSVHSE